jgi:hypothetical protein
MVAVDVETSIEINAARDRVAHFASDPENAPRWYVNISSVAWETPPPATVGSRIAFVAHFLGRRIAYTYVVRELVDAERFVMSTAEGPFPMQTTYSDLVRHVRDVELDGPSAARLEVDEQQPARGAQDVAGMRFAVQHLLDSATAEDPFTRVLQRAQEQPPVGLAEPGGLASAGDQPFRLGDSVEEVRRRDVDAAQTRVQVVERVRVGGG